MTDGGTGQRSSSRALLVAALAVVVGLGVIVSWFAWTPSCALREGERVGWWDGCDGPLAPLPWLSLTAVPALIAARLHHWNTRRLTGFNRSSQYRLVG